MCRLYQCWGDVSAVARDAREFCETVTTNCVRFLYDTNDIPVLH